MVINSVYRSAKYFLYYVHRAAGVERLKNTDLRLLENYWPNESVKKIFIKILERYLRYLKVY
jgi:hypothetical protein